MSTWRKFILNLCNAGTGNALDLLLTSNLIRDLKSTYDGPVLRVAILGLGSYGTRLQMQCRLVLAWWCYKLGLLKPPVGNPNNNILKELLQLWKYGIDAIKNNPDIDAVYVITPLSINHLHYGSRCRQTCDLWKPMALKCQGRSGKWSMPVKSLMPSGGIACT